MSRISQGLEYSKKLHLLVLPIITSDSVNVAIISENNFFLNYPVFVKQTSFVKLDISRDCELNFY